MSRILSWLWIVLGLLLCTFAGAQDIATFRLTNFDAFMETNTRLRQNTNISSNTETSIDDFQRESEFGITTQSYVFHPKFLLIDLSGAVHFQQRDVDRKQIALDPIRERETNTDILNGLWDLNATFRVLKDKPYPVTLTYFRENPVVQTGLEGSFSQTIENYGINMGLRDILPVNLTLRASRNTSSGKSLDRVIDNTFDRLNFSARGSSHGNNKYSFKYELTRQDALNGNPNRDIQRTVRTAHRADINSTIFFGKDERFVFNENASVNWRDNPEVLTVIFNPNLNWRHNSKFRSMYRYRFYGSDRPESDQRTISQGTSADLYYKPTVNMDARITLDGDKVEEADVFRQQNYGIAGSGRYNGETPLGDLNLSLGIKYDRNNRKSFTNEISIKEELITLSGTEKVPLKQEFVLESSIIVSNESGTQTLAEGLDYRLTTIGAVTLIERLIGGSILDGEKISIDYDVDTGGTFGYSVLDQSMSATLKVARYYYPFVQYNGSIQTLESGFSRQPLNSIRHIETGIRMNVPLRWYGIRVGGEARFTYHDEDISPFNSVTVNSYAEVPFPYRISLRVTARTELTDNKKSDEDRNLVRFSGKLNWRARRNLTLNLDGVFSQDDGGTTTTKRAETKLNVKWRYRKLSVIGEALYRQETQGALKRKNWEIMLTARREFF